MLTASLKTVIDSKHQDLTAKYNIERENSRFKPIFSAHSNHVLFSVLSAYFEDLCNIREFGETNYKIFGYSLRLTKKEQRVIMPVLDEINEQCLFFERFIMHTESEPYYRRDYNYGPLSSKEYFHLFQESALERTIAASDYITSILTDKPDNNIKIVNKLIAKHIIGIQKRGDIIMDSISRRLYHQHPSFDVVGLDHYSIHDEINSIFSPDKIH